MCSLRGVCTAALALLITYGCFVKSDHADDDNVDLPQIIQYQLLSMHSGRFLGVTGDNCIHAMGDIRDPRTKFIPRFTLGGRVAFESYCIIGHYIIFEYDTTTNYTTTRVRLGIPTNGSELFEQNSPFPGAFAYKSSAVQEEECYISFDSFGNAHEDLLCVLNTGHMGTLIRYIESVDETYCDRTHLKSSRIEL